MCIRGTKRKRHFSSDSFSLVTTAAITMKIVVGGAEDGIYRNLRRYISATILPAGRVSDSMNVPGGVAVRV